MIIVSEIEVVSEITEEELISAEGDKPELVEGLQVAYTVPSSEVGFDMISFKHFHIL